MRNLERFSTDQLEQRLRANAELASRIAAEQLVLLQELDGRQVPFGDGCRTMAEWVARTLDVGIDTARALVRTMRRTAERPDLRGALASGVSFDRVEALSRIPEPVGLWEAIDVGAVRREAALRGHLNGSGLDKGPDDRFLVLQPSLDESWWKLWGGLDAHAGAIVDKVLSEAADELPGLPDDLLADSGWRRATALVELCVGEDPAPAHISVFVDARHAAATDGDTGVVIESGPTVGRRALEAILCDSTTEVIARAGDGRYMDYGHKHRIVPPSLRRALVEKYRGTCAADGCVSRNRLQAHHVVPWSRGGRTDQDNLVLLCWFHHHVVVHERGMEPYPHPGHGRVRFRRSAHPVLARRP
jgi:5-methylcytosine-specific restriction endonuclease McrA